MTTELNTEELRQVQRALRDHHERLMNHWEMNFEGHDSRNDPEIAATRTAMAKVAAMIEYNHASMAK